MCRARTSDPSVEVNSTLSLTASTLLHRLVLLKVCFICPMSGRYSTNWDRKVWPGSEIQMYYGCPWGSRKLEFVASLLEIFWRSLGLKMILLLFVPYEKYQLFNFIFSNSLSLSCYTNLVLSWYFSTLSLSVYPPPFKY